MKPGDESGTIFYNWTTDDLPYMSIATALELSCDTVFDAFGADFYDRYVQNSIGEHSDLLERDLHEWGFEQPTGVDLPYEASGLVPDPAWASQPAQKTLFPYGWVPGGDILTMIGSGYVNVTPLQLARAYAAIANGGHLCQPHVVDQIIGANGGVKRKVDGRLRQDDPLHLPAALVYPRRAPQRGVLRHGQVCVLGIPDIAGRGRRQDRHRRAPACTGHVMVCLDGRPEPG